MSFSMSPPQKPASGALYAPYPNAAGSPTNPSPYGPPPAKRQRMSPDPRSPPNGTVGWTHTNHGLHTPGSYPNVYGPPNSAMQSPYANSPTYGSPHENSFNMPQPYPYQQSAWQSHPPPSAQPRQSSPPSQQSREAMPPPPLPRREEREERVGVEDIGDSLFGSGINLKDEENYMHAMYNNRHQHYHPRDSQSFSTNQNTSFGSSTMSPSSSFNLLTQGTSFGSQDALAGTLGRTRTEEDIELEQRKRRETAARAQAERKQHHLNNQFLQCNNVRKRMDKVARDQGVMLNMTGVFLLQEPQTNAMVNGASNAGIVATKEELRKPEAVVYQNTPFEHVLSLLSLAAGERVRGLLDEAYTLTRARRYGDHGRVVPPEFADIAEGEGKSSEADVVPENVTGTQWDRTPDPNTSASGTRGTADGVEKPASTSSTPQQTIAFQDNLNAQLRALVARGRQAEEERIKKRNARKRKASEVANSADTPPTDAAAPEATTTALEQPKLTKKEQMRQNKEKNTNTEAQLHQSTNQTAAMMAAGSKMKKYGWMQGGASSMPTNRFAKPTTSASASGTATPTKVGTGSAVATPGGVAMAKTGSAQGSTEIKAAEWGDWRETGKGIEMRDWVLVLERDGREKAALTKALFKLGT